MNLQEMDKILENRVIEKLFSSSNILGTLPADLFGVMGHFT